jgi:serine/threonine protein kinase
MPPDIDETDDPDAQAGERRFAGLAALNEIPPVPNAYRVIRKLGEGSTGRVWEVIRERDQERIALKIPHAAFRGIGTVPASLKRELALAKLLDHPNIVRILDLQEGRDGEQVIEMEYVEGVTLAEHVFRSPNGVLSWEELAPIARQLVEALIHSHERGVVHRDIKPANVILTAGHLVKLADFGSASMADAAVTLLTLSDSSAGVGTLAFMSPQQLNGNEPKPSDDIYALGATLYSLLTGRPPFQSGHIIPQILSKRPPSIMRRQRESGIRNPVPPAVDRLIIDCLAKKPTQRPKSARAMLERLDECASADFTRRRFLKIAPAAGLAVAAGGYLAYRGIPNFLPEDEFESIFNGRNLDGWTATGDAWRVGNGCIIASLAGLRTLDASGWQREFLDLDTPDLFDFELRMDVKLEMPLDDAGNLGVRYRVHQDPSGGFTACQLDFEPNWRYNCGLRRYPKREIMARPGQIATLEAGDPQGEPRVMGNLAGEKKLRSLYQHRKWNQITIMAQGGTLAHWLNGQQIIEYRDHAPPGAMTAGRLGLTVFLYYGPSVQAAFRNLRLRRIPTD